MSESKYSWIQHHTPQKQNRQTTQIRKVLQQHFFNSKTDTLAVATGLGDMLKESLKNVCI
jgi:alpha/beta superfamily hydrolase